MVQGVETPNVNLQVLETPSGTITGRVTNATSGAAVASATVTATGSTGSGIAITDSNGNYNI